MLYQAEIGGLGPTWRYGGETLSPADHAQRAFIGVLCQFLVAGNADNRVAGLVQGYNPDMSNRVAWLSVARFTPDSNFEIIEGAALFIEYMFQCWPLRRLFAEVAEYNFDQLKGSVRSVFRVEGTLTGRFEKFGRTWDLVYLSLSREDWEASAIRRRALRLPAAITSGS